MNTAAAVAEMVQAAWILKDGRGDCQPVVLREKDEKRIEIHKHLRVRDARLRGVPCGQPEGLGGEAMNTLPLFDQSPMPDAPQPTRGEKAERKAAMDAAFAHADARFKEEYERLLMRFVEQGREFTGFDVQDAYRERRWLPLPREWRATGAIYQRLRKNGTLEIVGYRPRPNGNPTAIYKGKV